MRFTFPKSRHVYLLWCSLLYLMVLQTGYAWAQEPDEAQANPLPGDVLPDSMTIEKPALVFDFSADIGLSRIENTAGEREQFFATSFMPEFFYGEYSAGLLLKMHVHVREGSTRKEDYDSFGDFLSVIRYVQYADKGVKGYYVRFGELEEATLGYGKFIASFDNSISLDNQKRGFEVNYRDHNYLIEAIYSNLIAPEVFGLRWAYFPLTDDPLSKYKLVSFGASLAGDLSNKGSLINIEVPGAPFVVDALTDIDGIRTAVGKDNGKIIMGGVDVSMPVFVTAISSGLAYGELSKIFGHGSGVGVGFSGQWQLPEDLRLELQLEQRFMGRQFIPNYFNSVYEALRLQTLGIPVDGQDDIEALNTRRNILTAQTKRRFGSYFNMAWRIKRLFRFRWSFENAWNVKNSAWIHVDLQIKSPEIPIFLRLRYDQLKTSSLEDFTVTGNNLNFFRLETAVRVMSMLMVGIGVRNSFEPDFHDGIPVGLKKRRRIEPKFVFFLPK